MPTLAESAQQIASSALPLDKVEYGGDPKDAPHPWLGRMSAKSADQVPPEFITGGTNFLYRPRSYSWKRRQGQTIKFDATGLPTTTGLLPAAWSSKGRWMDEFKSDSLASDGVPTVMALATRETVSTGLDDGRFSQVYVRDQVAGSNYTLGSEFSSTTYPALGSAQNYKVVPLWYDSGDGGLTRGTTEFARRFFVPGSRRFLKVGNWTYFPSVLGTPARWNGERSAPSAAALQASDDLTAPETWESVNCTEVWEGIQTSDDATAYASSIDSPGTPLHRMQLSGTVQNTDVSWTVNFRARRTGAVSATTTFQFYIVRADGTQFVSASILPQSAWTTSWTDYSATINVEQATGQTANSFALSAGHAADGTGNRIDVTYVSIMGAGASGAVNRLIPSGPLPPVHAGTIAAGTVVAGTSGVSEAIRPDADVTDGDWTSQVPDGTLSTRIDESAADDTDYITCAAGGAACTIGLGDLSFTPTSDYSVTVSFRARRTGGGSLIAQLLQTATTIATGAVSTTTSFANYSFSLTAAQVATITDWTALRISFTNPSVPAASTALVSQAFVTVFRAGTSVEGWHGKHRFYHSVACRFEDGSVWALCTPRAPNATLTSGYNLATVDSANPETAYDRIVWNNIPIGPHGTVSRILLRTPKIDSTTEDTAQLDPFDFRVVWEIKDNTTTTYDDFYADDDSLSVDTAEAFIRYDHIMPPRSRYIFGGDMRVCHSYGGQNPCAIIIAPVGQGADYDLNLPDTSATAYASQGSWMQIGLDTSAAGTLTLIQGDGATATNTKTFAFSTYTTLQSLVDAINATSFSADGQQWRAQLCPGVNPEATTLSLTPHNRAIASCVVDDTAGIKTITKAAGGLSKVAVGNLVSGAAEEAGATVTVINSDTSLTYTGTLTSTTETLYFYTELGDDQVTDSDTTALGFQRVIANSLPGFLYFTEDYLDNDPVHKQDVWMTVASPGQAKSAANNFSGRQSNRFAPPANAGISMGGGGVDQGFVVPFSNAIYAITNRRDGGSGLDEEYRLQAIHESEGCCAWNTVTPGNRFVPYLKPSGMYAADLGNDTTGPRERLLSEFIFAPPASDATSGTGDFDYEIPLCVAATGADTDGAYASARIMRKTLWVNYRDSSSVTRPDRQVAYDFSGGLEHSGLEALFRDDGRTPWGWSAELVRALTAMCAGRRSDGEHLYGWNDANAGSAGDGRLDEFETGENDNSTEITGSVELPWEKGRDGRQVSGQEVYLEHAAPAGSTGALDFTRSLSDTDLYSLTPSTGSAVVLHDPKQLPQAARVQANAIKVGYRQITGTARELRKVILRLKHVRSYG